MDAETNQLLETALNYAKGGRRVLPLHSVDEAGHCSCGNTACTSQGKHPLTRNGVLDAITDEFTICNWWEGWPHANIGMATGQASGIVVLDVDPRHGGEESMAKLVAQHGPLPETVESITGGGGRHIFFLHPGPLVKNRAGVAPGLDVRGDGGYIVAPGSTHASGREYIWSPDKHPDVVDLAPMPPWLLELVCGRSPKHSSPAVGERIPLGVRNDTLTSLAGTMRRRGITEEAIRAALLVENERCDPPLKEREVAAIAHSVARYPAASPGATSPKSQNATDLGNARRFAALHGEDVRYCHTWGCWLTWSGTKWEKDVNGEIERRAKQTVAALHEEAERESDADNRKRLRGHALHSESEARLKAMANLAKSEPGIPITPDELDPDPWLFNCLNGTMDLRTGDLRPHRRSDLITKVAPVIYDPAAKAPLWEGFLHQIMRGNQRLITFLQCVLGYCLTGDTGEQVLCILWGNGANGKSTFLETARALLGDYAQQAEFTTFLAKNRDSVRNDIARLVGARLVTAVEVENGRRLSEALVKQLTGQDKITARFLYGEFFEFTPQFKLLLAGNHKPVIKGSEGAIWRRVRLVPFTVTIPPAERDKALLEKLRGELPGILRWAVQGCLDWQKHGLGEPDEVLAATEAYRNEMDSLAEFISDCCQVGDGLQVTSADLYFAYEAWCRQNGEKAVSKSVLGRRLEERGFSQTRSGKNRVRGWDGLKVKPFAVQAQTPDRTAVLAELLEEDL